MGRHSLFVVVLGLVLSTCAAPVPVATDPASESPTPAARSPVTTPSPSATHASAGPVRLPPPDPIHDGHTVEFEAGSGRDAGVIPGFDGQAFVDAWENQGFTSACTGPKMTTGTLLGWTCGNLGGPYDTYYQPITLIGESSSAVYLILASILQADGGPVDADQAGNFLGYVAETAEFTGADTAAARAWTVENVLDNGQLEISGVTYTLSGTAERRVLQIAPSISSN